MNTHRSLLPKLSRHRHDIGLVVEATLALVLATAVIRFLSFRRILRLASFDEAERDLEPEAREQIGNRVRWAVKSCAKQLPWHPLCFPQGLAAQWMLRRRGIASTFYYGATVGEEEVQAHVWVCDGDTPIVGGRAPERLKVLVQAPAGAAILPGGAGRGERQASSAVEIVSETRS